MRDLLAESQLGIGDAEIAATGRAVKHRAVRIRRALGMVILVLLAAAGSAQAGSKDSMQGLDEQVQEIKSDVLAIATELQQLEEKLLYPSDTQVSVFVSLAAGESLELDSLQIRIDGESVARHVYEFKELEALRKGGMQRIYTGNVSTGEHQLEVSAAGTSSGGSKFEETQNFSFRKEVEPKVIDLALAGRTVGGIQIELGGD